VVPAGELVANLGRRQFQDAENYTERKLSQILGRTPKNIELAEMLGVSEQKIYELKNYMAREPISIDHLNTERFTDEED